MNIPTFDNVCKYEDAHDSFYDALEYLAELPWMGGFTSVWVAATILSLVEQAGRENKKVRIWMTLPEDFLVFDFCPMSLTAERYNSESVNKEGFVVCDELMMT